MKKILLFLFTILFYSVNAQIAFQGFEGTAGDNWSFTPSPSTYNVSGDVWAIVNSVGSINSGATATTNFWGMQDLNNPNGGGNFDHTLTFSQNITDYIDVTVSFYYNAIGYDGGDDLDYELLYDGTSQGVVNLIDGQDGGGVSSNGWEQVSVSVPNSVNMVTLVLIANQNGASDYGGWDNIEIDGTSQLPITLTTFTAKPMDTKTIALNWQTASEENNDYFSIEHSTDGRNFTELGLVEGVGTTFEAQDYDFMHKGASKGMNYYRLRQVDFDGTFAFSSVQAVELANNADITLRPTLASHTVDVLFSSSLDQDTEVEVINIMGRTVIREAISAGTDKMQLDVQNLNQGPYFLRTLINGKIKTIRFIKI